MSRSEAVIPRSATMPARSPTIVNKLRSISRFPYLYLGCPEASHAGCRRASRSDPFVHAYVQPEDHDSSLRPEPERGRLSAQKAAGVFAEPKRDCGRRLKLIVECDPASLADFHHSGTIEDHPSPNQFTAALARPDGLAHYGLAVDLLHFALTGHGVVFPSAGSFAREVPCGSVVPVQLVC